MQGDLVPLDVQPKSPRRRFAVAHAWLQPETYSLLERAALSRHQHPDSLAAQIIEQVLIGAEAGGFLE